MLRFMKIRDFALIRELEIEFHTGLNLLTGETGSGKSILVDALSVLLGERCSPEMVRSGCNAATLEGCFFVEGAPEVKLLLSRSGIEPEEDTLLIRREISTTGRNRVFINNSLATLSLLKTIGTHLADIHGQHDQQGLLDLTSHLEWLDRFGGNTQLAAEVEKQFKTLRETAAQLDSMNMNEQERLRRTDVLQFQLEEIRRANLQPHERETLEGERHILANREKILSLANDAYGSLYEDDPSLLSIIKRLEHILRELVTFDSAWTTYGESLKECAYKLEDIAFMARDYSSGIDFSPERLDQVEQRLIELDRLGKKYGSSVEEIFNYAGRCQKELEDLVSYSNTSKSLTEKFEAESHQYRAVAERLSEKRQQDAARLEREIRKEFQALSMDKMLLKVQFEPHSGQTYGRIPGCYGIHGIDHVEFLVAPNKGENMRPLARIASGGELSRVMLAIQTLCGAGKPGKTLVFDEVDAGIGGRVAEAVGRRLDGISKNGQVLCVTHLPQIASFARHHFSVWKDTVGSRTETFVKHLDHSERVHEVARMLGGEVITDTTRTHAREMLERAQGLAKSQIQ